VDALRGLKTFNLTAGSKHKVKEFWKAHQIPVDAVVRSEQVIADGVAWDTKSDNSVSFRKPVICGDRLIPQPPSTVNDTAHTKKLNMFLDDVQNGSFALELQISRRRSELHTKFRGPHTKPDGNTAPKRLTLTETVPQQKLFALHGYAQLASVNNVKPTVCLSSLSEATTQSGCSSHRTSRSSEDG